MEYWHCNNCRTVIPLTDGKEPENCLVCGEIKGYKVSAPHAKEALESGAFFNIDPKTGKRKK